MICPIVNGVESANAQGQATIKIAETTWNIFQNLFDTNKFQREA